MYDSYYGNTKRVCEEILQDAIAAEDFLRGIALRYFNPIGAHPSALIGELPSGIPDNLVPYITQTAIGLRPELRVFGDDYRTPDGTCVRDYVHVVDLARAQTRAPLIEAVVEADLPQPGPQGGVRGELRGELTPP